MIINSACNPILKIFRTEISYEETTLVLKQNLLQNDQIYNQQTAIQMTFVSFENK